MPLTKEQVKSLGEYIEGAKEKVHIISSIGFVWEVGKTVIEGWHSIWSFILGVNWVLGWIGLVLMFSSAALPIAVFLGLLFVGVQSMAHDHFLLGTIFLLLLLLAPAFFEPLAEFWIKLVTRTSDRLAMIFVSVAITASLILSVTVHIPSDDSWIVVIRIFGWMVLSLAGLELLSRLIVKRHKQKTHDEMS